MSDNLFTEFNSSNNIPSNYVVFNIGVKPDGTTTNAVSYNLMPASLDNLASFDYKIDLDFPVEEILKKGKNTGELLMDVLNQANSIQSALKNSENRKTIDTGNNTEKLGTIWKNLPAFKGISPLGFPSELTFKFWFGQRGIFDGKKEVYDPIIKIAKAFAPSWEKGKITHSLLPLSGSVLFSAGSALLKNSSDSGSTPNTSESNSDSESETVVGDLYNKVANVMKELQNGLLTSYKDNHQAMCNFVLGKLTSPVFIVKGVKWNFNYSNMDENDYPMAGSISLTGCQTLYLATQEKLNGMFGEDAKKYVNLTLENADKAVQDIGD
jgi:hypothetical protein